MQQHINKDDRLGRSIRRLRLYHGFGVGELALRLQLEGIEISRVCIYKIESGQHHVTVDLLMALHRVFDVPYESFFDFEEDES